MLRKIAIVLALLLTPVCPVVAQSSNQPITCTQLVSAVGAGTFAWTSTALSCGPYSDQIVYQTLFTGYVHNNGSCFSGQTSTYIPLYSDMLACKYTSSYTYHTLTCNGYNITYPATQTCTGGTASITSSSYPLTASPGAQTICTYSVKIAGTAVLSTTGGGSSGTYTGGSTGTVSVTVGSTPSHVCTSSSISIGYYT